MSHLGHPCYSHPDDFSLGKNQFPQETSCIQLHSKSNHSYIFLSYFAVFAGIAALFLQFIYSHVHSIESHSAPYPPVFHSFKIRMPRFALQQRLILLFAMTNFQSCLHSSPQSRPAAKKETSLLRSRKTMVILLVDRIQSDSIDN